MKLYIDNYMIEAQPGQSLRELITALGLERTALSTRPLAAKIAGEVFTLNYIPVRQTEATGERQSMRRAMAASQGQVHLLRYGDSAGRDVYKRTSQFVLFLALRQLWPMATSKMTCKVGSGIFINVSGAPDFSAARLKERVAELVAEDIPLIRRRVALQDAIAHFEADGLDDKVRLLKWRTFDYFDEYAYGDFADYFYGEMMPSTGYLQNWDIRPAEGGFIFVYPDDYNPDQISDYHGSPNFYNVYAEGERWCELMECETVADLNDLTTSGRIRELIRVN